MLGKSWGESSSHSDRCCFEKSRASEFATSSSKKCTKFTHKIPITLRIKDNCYKASEV